MRAPVEPTRRLVPLMASPRRPGVRRAGLRGIVAAALISTALASPAAASAGGTMTFDLYRSGTYSMQATWTWCTAASVQIMRNILLDQEDHSAANQQTFFTYMREENRLGARAHRGVDPQGFQAGLQAFVDPRYRLVASRTFDDALHSAVLNLRLSGEPVALIVSGGRHAWVLTGFSATADPAATSAFRVLSVRIVGPLYGRQSINGYDPPPDTRLSAASFAEFLLPYRFPFAPTPWSGRYLTFQVVPGWFPHVWGTRPV